MLPEEATLAPVRAALAPRFQSGLCAPEAVENHPSRVAILLVAPPGNRAVLLPSFDS
jgi:hypothetical protein